MENNLQEIKEKIRTINPNITDELLDLLYEYMSVKLNNEFMQLPAFQGSHFMQNGKEQNAN